MKAFIFASASLAALLLASSPALAGDHNSTTIQQIGTAQIATVDQTKTVNSTVSIAQGLDSLDINNSAHVTQMGQNNATYVNQYHSPDGGQATGKVAGGNLSVEQDGSHGMISDIQDGDNNAATIIQTANSTHADSTVYQSGTGNQAISLQSGDGDTSMINQGALVFDNNVTSFGNDGATSDTANVTQSGYKDQSMITQYGNNNNASVTQGGANEVATIKQGLQTGVMDGTLALSVNSVATIRQ